MYRNMKLAVLSLLVTVCGHVSAETIEYLVIEEQARPFQIVDEKDRHSGIVTDLMREIVKGSEHELNIHRFPFKRMQKIADSNHYENWVSYGAADWAPPQNKNLTECSILTVGHEFLPPKGVKRSIESIKDLFGERLILLFGFTYPNLDSYIRAENISTLYVQSYHAAFKALHFKRGEGFVEMGFRIRYNLKQLGYAYSDYYPVDLSHIIPPYDIHFSLSPNMTASLKSFINQRCLELKRKGTIAKIIDRYTH